MSNKRASIRRNIRAEEKLKKSKAPGAEFARIKNEGWKEGKTLAICVGLESLHEDFGWKRGKLNQFSDKLAFNTASFNKEVLQMAVKPWERKLGERVEEVAGNEPRMFVDNFKDKIKYEERNKTYVAAASLMMLVLFSEYNFSSNSKRTGRMDKIIERYTIRYLNIIDDPNYYSARKYAERIKNTTGMIVA